MINSILDQLIDKRISFESINRNRRSIIFSINQSKIDLLLGWRSESIGIYKHESTEQQSS